MEAKAAAALNHNNIATIHNIEEADDEIFIVMEYIRGRELKEKIEAGSLSLEEAIHIALQISKGLQAAHAKGIVHRDIKSSNIMLTDEGDVKIMDFGQAKVGGRTRLTKEGTTMGTVAYMSPEQARGDEVDHRGDIFSLGVLMYEMLTGRLPFRGDYDQAVIYSILNEEPEAVTDVRPGIPGDFERIIGKCLEKESSTRYVHSNELIEDLEMLRDAKSRHSKVVGKNRGLTPIQITVGLSGLLLVAFLLAYWAFGSKSEIGERIPIAVADVLNETGEKELDGLSGLLTTSLEQSQRLSVLTRSGLFDILKQMDKLNIQLIDEQQGREICNRASINFLATAAIKKFGQIYTLDVKVLDTNDNNYFLTASANGEGRESIPDLIDKLARRIREGFKEESSEIQAKNQSVTELTTSNMEAYRYYYLGETFLNQFKYTEAINEFNRAVTIDSTFALAHLWLAIAKSTIGLERDKEAIRMAMKYIAEPSPSSDCVIAARLW